MNMWKNLAGGVALGAIVTGFAQPALAQTTTSSVGGSIDLADGSPAAGAQVVLTDTRTGNSRTATTNASGGFGFQGLNVGGPYTIDVTMVGQQPIKLTDVSVALGSPTAVNLEFSGGAGADVVVITGTSSTAVAQVATGPAASFNLETLEHAPAINSDVKDVLKLDPRIFLDESFGGSAGADGIQCGGAHPRYTSLTVDGITMSDGFGLGTNNYPSERMPFPYGAIQQVSVELAPFSVLYGGFTGCNVNAVTKSGTNKFHGSVSYDYTNDGLRSHRTLSPITRITNKQRTDRVPEFEEKRYQAWLGGPIIPDHLFFSVAYEKSEFSNFFTRGPAGSGAPVVPTGLTQAVYDQIVDTAKTKYGYDPGGTVLDSPQQDEKYLARLDWNISDRHRVAVSYDHSKAFQLVESNTGGTSFEFSTHLYQRGGELDSYSGEWLADWTDNFSTDLRYGRNEWDGTVKCLDGAKFGEVRITLASGTNVYMGCDRSRQANDLNYTVDTIVANGTYRVGDHAILGGFEQRGYEIFNQFVQDAQGTYFFGNTVTDGVTKFINGTPDTVQYASARITNNPVDASATFGYDINTLYLQDTFDASPTLNFNVGLRYEWFTSDDKPRLNNRFVQRYGFRNNETLDGLSILQPRFSFNWEATPDIKIHGGLGLFSGGNPNVYLSNGFSTDGQTLLRLIANGTTTQGLSNSNIGTTSNPFTVFNIFNETFVNDEGGHVGGANPGGVIWGLPKKMFDAVGAGAAVDTEVDAVDPNFHIPAAWKFNIGGSWDFSIGNLKDFFFTADWLYSKDRYAPAIVDLSLVKVGNAPDGQPVYRRIDPSVPGCAASPGTVTAASTITGCRRTTSDFMLTNSSGGYQNVISFSLSKSWLDESVDTMIGYAHMDSRDRSPMTSSVAFSNWANIATSDINNNPLANSNYEIPNRWTMQLGYHKAFFGDYESRITLTGQAYQSKPYTFTFVTAIGTDGAWGDNQPQVHLFYVPSGPGATDDPKVTYLPAFTTKNPATGLSQLDLLNRAIDVYKLPRGRTVSRNEFEGQWNNKFDLKLEQEFPGGFPGAKATGFVIVENIGNLVNSDWGQVYESPFPSRTALVQTGINASGQYVYQGTQALSTAIGTPVQAEQLVPAVSFWTVKLGVSYKF